MAAESLIPAEARAMIGQRLDPPSSGEVLDKETRRYAYAVGDENPLYFDADYARAAGYEGTIAPPLFFEVPLREAVSLADLRTDGIAKSRQAPIPLKVDRVMAGGQEVELFKPVYPGDTLTAETRLVDITEKTGRSGPFVLIVRETTYTNQHGEVVVKSRSTGIVR
jgi:acyl dehydratase